MDGLLILVLIAGLYALAGGTRPARHERLRGANKWTTWDDAQKQHYDHWFSSQDSHTEDDQ